MKKRPFSLFAVLLISVVVLFSGFTSADVRKSLFAGKFYPSHANEIRSMIEDFRDRISRDELSSYSTKELKALIMPHAGYFYSGWTASHATFLLEESSFNKVIVMGPDHTTGFKGSIVNCADSWHTLLGHIEVHRDAKKISDEYSFLKSMEEPYLREHSIEVILPFLQYALKEFSLVPVVVGRADIDKTAAAMESIIDNDTLIVASSDLSHYLNYSKAKKADRGTIDNILQFKYKKLLQSSNSACGRLPVAVLLRIAEKKGWEPFLIHYSNSGDASGDHGKVVGYSVIAFFKKEHEQMNQEFTSQQGETLLNLARITIAEKLGVEVDEERKKTVEQKLDNDIFTIKRGVFVTLHKKGRLRGCIGSLSSDLSVRQGIVDNAVNAAFKDPRFPALDSSELENIDIEVSILTTPKELEYSDSQDLLSKLRPHIDGLIIKRGFRSATFLPQVWEQLPDPKTFLSHLCRKAGLKKNEWRDGTVKVMTYQVRYFKE